MHERVSTHTHTHICIMSLLLTLLVSGDAHGPVSGGYSVSVLGANFGTSDTGVVSTISAREPKIRKNLPPSTCQYSIL